MPTKVPNKDKPKDGSAAARWKTLDARRHAVLERARAASELTLTSVQPPDGATEETVLDTPFQGLGAQGVNSMTSKLMLALLPPQTSFFQMEADEALVAELENENPEIKSQANEAFVQAERGIQQDIEADAIRTPATSAIRSLIVTGNGFMKLPDKGPAKSYRLDQCCVLRDGSGNLLELVIKEQIDPKALPEDVKVQLGDLSETMTKSTMGNAGSGKKEDLDVYTWVYREGNKWYEHQEILDKVIQGSQGNYPLDKNPYLVMRWTALPGENYGRGHVEGLYGDIKSLEGLSRALIKGTAAAAKLVYLINPAGVTRPEHLARASTGDIIRGREEDVGMARAEKGADFQVALVMMERIEKRLKESFLMTSSVTRNAERVTAEEIRLLASELETALGGVFSLLSQEFQRPLLNRLLVRAQKRGALPKLPKGSVKFKIVTGLDALGRGQNFEKLRLFAETMSMVPGGLDALNSSDFGTRVANSMGIDPTGLLKTSEQIQAEQQQAQMQNAVGGAIPGVAQEATKGVVQQRLADNQSAG